MRLITAQLSRLALFTAVVAGAALASNANAGNTAGAAPARVTSAALTKTDTAAHTAAHTVDMQTIQQLTWAGDMPALSALCNQLDLNAHAAADAQAHYVAAYCDYRIAYAGNKDRERYAPAMSAALARAELRLLRLGATQNVYQVESLALLSTVYGLQISLAPAKGAVLGMKAGAAIAAAENINAHNPRVQLFKGVGKLFTPPMFGGDKALAIAAFDKAIAALPAGGSDALNWGLEDAYIWRSIALQDSDKVAAKISLELALSIAPQHGWARQQLAALAQAQ